MQLSLLPMPVVSAVFVVVGMGVILGIVCAAWWLGPRHPDPETRAELFDVAKLIGAMLGLFMIFVMSQCMNYYRTAELAVAKEAGDVLQLDRALAGVPSSFGQPARLRLQEYVRSVVEQEWPAMERFDPSEETQRRLDQLEKAVSLMLVSEPSAANLRSMQRTFNDLEDDRNARLASAEGGVPVALWWTIKGLGLLLAISLFQLRLNRRQFLSIAPYLASLLLLTALLFMMDGPFGGSTHVESGPLQRSLSRLAVP